MWISNEKQIYQKNYFLNVVVIQSSVLTMILGQDNYPFVYPNHECTHSYQLMKMKRKMKTQLQEIKTKELDYTPTNY
jgi:hypothetical protein